MISRGDDVTILKTLAKSAMVALGSIGSHVPEVGEQAPLFEADSNQGTIRLADYLGKKQVVLAFYLADFTPV
jgi:hypothetical protein